MRVGETRWRTLGLRGGLGRRWRRARHGVTCHVRFTPSLLLPLHHPLSSYSCSCSCSHVSRARAKVHVCSVKYTLLAPPPSSSPNKLTRAALIRQTLRTVSVVCMCVCVHARARVVSAKSTLGSRQVLGKILADAQLSSWLMNEQASSVTVGIWDRSRVIRGKGDHARFTRSRFPILHDGCIVNGWIYRYPRFASEFSFFYLSPTVTKE